jgi:hypothetical protein
MMQAAVAGFVLPLVAGRKDAFRPADANIDLVYG